jgi:transcriptional regulator GlxA family with amidase domain
MVNEVQIRTLYIQPDASPLLPCVCTVVEVSALLRELIYALLEEPVDYAPDSRGALIAQLILSELRCLRTMPLHLPMPKDARLVRLCQTFLDQPGTDYPFEQLAEAAGASTRTLARLFQAETGMSFRIWRQQVRLIEALGLLAQGQPVGQVAGALGYRSQSAFSAMFQRALGVEPSRYFASDDPA